MVTTPDDKVTDWKVGHWRLNDHEAQCVHCFNVLQVRTLYLQCHIHAHWSLTTRRMKSQCIPYFWITFSIYDCGDTQVTEQFPSKGAGYLRMFCEVWPHVFSTSNHFFPAQHPKYSGSFWKPHSLMNHCKESEGALLQSRYTRLSIN